MDNFLNIFLYFIIYSFIGWVCETVYCSIYDKRIINRGFIHGPFCPIYGFGSLGIIYVLPYFNTSFLGVFFGGMILTSIIEYFTSYLLEITFHTSWWDYSNEKFNINGRVCLKNSIFFGIMSVSLYFYLHSYITSQVAKINREYALAICIIFAVLFTIDFLFTVVTILKINKKIAIIENIKSDILKKYNDLKHHYKENHEERITFKENLHNEFISHTKKVINEFKISEKRLINAFPKMKNKKFNFKVRRLKKFLKK